MSRAVPGSAPRRLHSLVRPRGKGRLIQRFRRDVCPVRPSDGTTVQEELPKVCRVLQGLEYRPQEPRFEVNDALGAVVEGESNPEVVLVICTYDVRQENHDDLAQSSGGIRSSG